MVPITVLLADDHALLRSGVRMLLHEQPDIRVVAEARDGREAVEMSQLHHPDIVVMDVQMPRLDGLEALRELSALLPGTKLLVLSSQTGDDTVERAVEAGAAAFVAKHTGILTLPRAIRAVMSGQRFLGLSPHSQPTSV